MTAALCRAFGEDLVLETVDLAPPQAGEVRVAIKACAICHSDILYMRGAWGGALPAVFGHEPAGIVAEIGDGVSHVCVGDHVVVALIRSCRDCHYCARGEQVLCETVFPLDRSSRLACDRGAPIHQGLRTGAFAEQVVVEASQVVRIDPDIAFDVACLLACGVITGVGAVTNTARVPAGSSVVVIGVGGVGLNTIQGAVIAGAARIVAVDIVESKLARARLFGATDSLNSTVDDVASKIRVLTQGRGADYVFVTVAAAAAFEQAFDYTGKAGTVVVVGMPPTGVMSRYDPGTLASWNQRVIGSKMGSSQLARDVPLLVGLYREGKLKLDELISGRFDLPRINEAIASAAAGEAVRNVIVFA